MIGVLCCAGVMGLGSGEVEGGITGVTEVGLGGDTPAIIVSGGFGEDALTFSDRTHQHNGAAFSGGVLSTTGTEIVPLPNYLLGQDYVRFANNARENDPYSATVTADAPLHWYLLLDNRVNGPAGNNSSPNTTDAELGGALQWVLDGGWERVNTGISPGNQGDYTGVDEGGNAVGAGQGLNQFYSVWTQPLTSTSIVVQSNGIGGNNMISLVGSTEGAGPPPPPEPPDPPVPFASPTFALVDIGATDGRPEPGAAEDLLNPGVAQHGGGLANQNGPLLPETILLAGGDAFTIEVDNVDQTGAPVGNLDWRDAGDGVGGDPPFEQPLVKLGEDFVKNNGGIVRVKMVLPAGAFDVTSFHVDARFDQADNIQIFVDDAATDGYVDTGIVASADVLIGGVNELSTADMLGVAADFTVISDGVNPVMIVFDGRQGTDVEVPFNGLAINSRIIPEPASLGLLGLGSFALVRRRRVV